VFLGHSNLAMLCMRESWTEAAGSELLRGSGFDVEDLVEDRAPEGATTRFEYVSPEWARRWPSEEVLKARKFRSWST
jgi:hypothetical protein